MGALLCPSLFAFEATVCKRGTLERKVEIKSESSEKKVPCQVMYLKEGETEAKALWNAQADAAYCETKATEFVEKLVSMGWQCAASSASTEAATSTP